MSEKITTTPRPIWRTLLFWLVGMALVVCVIAVCLPIARSYWQIKNLRENGGIIWTLEKPDWMPESVSSWLVEKDMPLLHHVTSILFDSRTSPVITSVSVDLQGLTSFTHLKTLTIQYRTVHDSELRHLQSLTELQDLEITNTTITDAGLVPMSRLSKLNSLEIYGNKTTKAGIQKLKRTLPDCIFVEKRRRMW